MRVTYQLGVSVYFGVVNSTIGATRNISHCCGLSIEGEREIEGVRERLRHLARDVIQSVDGLRG
jgi:hypothetical protein